MKALFPLPLVYDGNESRYLQRDGARFAAEFRRRGDCGIKLLIRSEPHPEKCQSPLLDTATWQDWCSQTYWRDSGVDFVLLYGGLDPRLLAVARSIKAANIALFLKMDSAIGIAPSWKTDCLRLIRTGYHVQHQKHTAPVAIVKSLAYRVKEMLGLKQNWLNHYLPLFDVITAESEYAVENTKKWLSRHDRKDLVAKVQLLPHPIPEHFHYEANRPRKDKKIIAIAQDWTNPLKGGKLLTQILKTVLTQRRDYTAIVVGGASDSIVAAISQSAPEIGSRITALARIDSDKTKDFYASANIFITTSGSEGWPLVASEAACCGCSVVFPPELKQLRSFEESNSGRMAKWRSAKRMSEALLEECQAWDKGLRDPVSISCHWGTLTHTSQGCDLLLKWLDEARSSPNRKTMS